jgi:3-oxoacyl-[acyl-carrier-protein] synthase II
MALEKAGVKPHQVDYINAHGTSTLLNDRMETRAVKTVFGEHAYKIPMSSTKSQIGHMIGGAGAVEAAICVMAINRGVIPPTMNLIYADPECDLDYVPNVPRRAKLKTVLTNSFGFGGHNSSLVFRAYREKA